MIPKSINILGKKIKIKTKADTTLKFEDAEGAGAEDEEVSGYYSHDEGYIMINSSLSEDMQWVTLLHEMVHAVMGITGLSEVVTSDKEEAICRAMENLAPILALRPKPARKPRKEKERMPQI